ncbi:nucleolar complex protein 2 homolog [Oppia nitens]|uniref:nucleolar complex protein 2 homolog n=1 Tax=Oppia nitens TaxID=1686743 RepID=UPI0023DCD5AC|nr:nucleolar complex protein 2 homolog [Oppia nitens]
MAKIKTKSKLFKTKKTFVKKKKGKDVKKPKVTQKETIDDSEDVMNDSQRDDMKPMDSSDDNDSDYDDIDDYKKTLDKLKEKDSEFYEFLQENDQQLLDFDVNDEEVEEDEDNDENEDFDTKTQDLSEKLSVKTIDKWSDKLSEKADIETIKSVVKWFRKAVEQTSGECDGKLMSADVFNSVINICLIDLLPAIQKCLKLPPIDSSQWSNDVKSIDPTKSRNWKKMISVMKIYLTDVIKMVGVVTEMSLKTTLLRHILYLIPFLKAFPHLIKRVLKQTMTLWSESDEKNRILSFICILRLVRTQEQPMISFILKKLYLSYIKNSKYMKDSANQTTIVFMKHSLVELYSLDPVVAYQHAFVFIRQLAINLRTAMTIKKKESYKSVYNWQYLHSILLWTQLLCSHNSVDELKPLITPLVNVIIGTIRLQSSPKFFPMRFHLINALIKLSDETNTFIPIFPFITQILDHFDKLKKNKPSNDEKELNLDLLIKVSTLNTNDFKFRDAVIRKIYDLLLYYLSTQSHVIAFPELVYISVVKVRKFLKRSHVIQHNQLLKQLLDKIDENSKLICDKRRNVDFSITNSPAINSWETDLKAKGTPITSFFKQRNQIKVAKQLLHSESINNDSNASASEPQPNDIAFSGTTASHKSNKSNKRKFNENKTLDKHEEQEDVFEDKSETKRTKQSKKNKRRVKNKEKKRQNQNVSFDFNQTLDISSDDSE